MNRPEIDEADALARAYEAEQAADFAEETVLLDEIYRATERLLLRSDIGSDRRLAVVEIRRAILAVAP